MHKLTLLAAVGAVAVSGCDFSNADTQFTTEAPVVAIEVSDLASQFRGADWDTDGNPDVFVEIRNSAGRSFFRSATITDADVSETLTFNVADVMVASPTMPLFISVFDYDESLIASQEMASSAPFTAEDLAAGSLELGNGRTSIVVR